MKKNKKQNINEAEEKECKCNDNCTCGDNCTCDENHKCSDNCTCGDECHCGDDCHCGEHCDCENEIKFDAENDLNIAIIKNNKDLLLNENCCTCINIMLSNDGRILTSFLGCHNPYIVDQLEKAQKVYFKGLKKALKSHYYSDEGDHYSGDCHCGCDDECKCSDSCDCGDDCNCDENHKCSDDCTCNKDKDVKKD